MITVKVLDQSPRGDMTRVVVELESPEFGTVHEEDVGDLEYGSAYHESLHTDRVDHRHNRAKEKVTVFLTGEFTQEKLDAALADSIASMEQMTIEEFVAEPSEVQEVMYVDGADEKKFYRTPQCPSDITNSLVAAFPDVDLSELSLISTPSHHSLLNEDVISTFLWEDDVAELVIDGVKLISRSRKYCMTSQKTYDRCYTFVGDETFSFLPEGCTALAKSFHINIDDGLELPDFYDVYFTGDAAVVEAAFGLPHKVGKQTTYYAVTVLNGTVERAKQYLYDTPTIFHDWSGTVKRAAANHGVVL